MGTEIAGTNILVAICPEVLFYRHLLFSRDQEERATVEIISLPDIYLDGVGWLFYAFHFPHLNHRNLRIWTSFVLRNFFISS